MDQMNLYLNFKENYNYILKMNGSTEEEDGLKDYIKELFNQYDTNKKGALTFAELSKFFEDLLKSVGISILYTPQQIYEVIHMCNPNYNGLVNSDEVYQIFKLMLGQAKKTSEQPGQNTQMGVQYQPYQITGMPTMMTPQYMGQMGQVYNPYIMQNPYGAQNPYAAQNPYTGQMWYMGMPFGNHRPQ